MRNLTKLNFLEQQLILKEIEVAAYAHLDESNKKKGLPAWDMVSEGVARMEACLIRKKIAELRKENFPEDEA